MKELRVERQHGGNLIIELWGDGKFVAGRVLIWFEHDWQAGGEVGCFSLLDKENYGPRTLARHVAREVRSAR